MFAVLADMTPVAPPAENNLSFTDWAHSEDVTVAVHWSISSVKPPPGVYVVVAPVPLFQAKADTTISLLVMAIDAITTTSMREPAPSAFDEVFRGVTLSTPE